MILNFNFFGWTFSIGFKRRMITTVNEVFPMRKAMDAGPCPEHPKLPMWMLSTVNEWKYYCTECGKRRNDAGEEMPPIEEIHTLKQDSLYFTVKGPKHPDNM